MKNAPLTFQSKTLVSHITYEITVPVSYEPTLFKADLVQKSISLSALFAASKIGCCCWACATIWIGKWFIGTCCELNCAVYIIIGGVECNARNAKSAKYYTQHTLLD